jgi:DNA processing protein
LAKLCEWKKRADMDTVILQRENEQYPNSLEKLGDPPLYLYVKGRLFSGPKVAIVGSRKPDLSAVRFASRLAADLSAQGIGIVSGGAMGIDTAAHKGAIEGGGLTISVIGSGFSYLYPTENKELFEMIEAQGALVTEYHDAQPPTKWTFPKRNRIIAAFSDAVVVVQAATRSGALITARLARELGIPVGAVPGVPGDPRNRGNHNLLRTGATVVEGAEDVLRMISNGRCAAQLTLPAVAKLPSTTRSTGMPQDPAALKILEILCTRPLHIDDISLATGLLPNETSAAVLALELQGLIEDRGGKNFVRVG